MYDKEKPVLVAGDRVKTTIVLTRQFRIVQELAEICVPVGTTGTICASPMNTETLRYVHFDEPIDELQGCVVLSTWLEKID